jgi:hypothetical protein
MRETIDWDSLDSHKNFINSHSYEPFVGSLLPFTDGVHLHHFTPSTFPPTIIGSAPVIEFATFYNTEPVFLSNTQRFLEAVDGGGKVEGYLGGVYGEV